MKSICSKDGYATIPKHCKCLSRYDDKGLDLFTRGIDKVRFSFHLPEKNND